MSGAVPSPIAPERTSRPGSPTRSAAARTAPARVSSVRGGGADGAGAPAAAVAAIDDRQAGLFRRRARALFALRAALIAGLALAAMHPPLAASLGVAGAGVLLPAGLALGAIAARLLVDHPLGRAATFASVCLDALGLLHLLVATGGLFSPLLGTQVVLVAAAGLLFAHPAALLPALLVPPLAALLQPAPLTPADLFLLVWYGGLDLAVVAVLAWLRRRDEDAHRAEARLAAALREHAVLAERERLSREVHDGVGASLSALAMQAELACRRAPGVAEVAELRASAEEAIDELRRSVRMLRGDFDLRRAAEEHCDRFARRTRLPLRFSAHGEGCALAPEAQLALFRVLQEALHNALRHADAGRVDVRLELGSAGARLVVRDDGRGFFPCDAPEGHYGLRGMRERARSCGGSLAVRSAPGAGTEIELHLPPRDRRPGGERG